ncbi:MAG TPA: hypothetical protein P5060_04050 [Candidatus Absconditabacterales bacterium]|nr:hypothetical protein [Candidatus Absconditabacterales bacterium]
MKSLTKKIFLGIMIFVLVVLGVEVFGEFMANHTYYLDMFSNGKNWWIMIGAIVSAFVPVLYLLKNKKFSLKKFTIFLFVGLLLFSLLHMGIKGGLLGSGFIIFIINTTILFILGAYFLAGILALGTWLSKLIIKFKENRIQELFLKFGFGLGVLLLFVQLLMGFGLFHPILIWIIFLGFGFLIWYLKGDMKNHVNILSENLSDLKVSNIKQNRWKRALIILVLFSIMYYFYGFQLSFIPYSTAWDANHAYMYVPKVIAENFGLIRGNIGTASTMPFLRHSFIAFWFSIGSIFGGGWLSADTIAVSMNFLSGPLVLLFGLVLINEVITYISEKIKISEITKGITFGAGWMTLLLWLTSGMGAFLVFIDNKTDLGVMALTLLAMLSGFVFIRYIAEHKAKKLLDKESLKYLIISGFFFALASMAKPSAFIDVVVFAVLLFALWINSISAFGIGTIVVGMMGIIQPQNAADFMGPSLGKWIVLIGIIITGLGILQMFVKNTKLELLNKKKLLGYILIWGIALIGSLLIFKGPWLAYKQVKVTEDFGASNFVKGLFLSKNDAALKHGNAATIKLYAATDTEVLEEQNEIDKNELRIVNGELGIEQCLSADFTEEELKEGMREAEKGNEDVGRYVGYGWKEFNHNNRLSYKLLRLIYVSNNKCFSANSSAKVLCEYQDEINQGNIQKLEEIEALGLLKPGSEAEEILQNTLENYKENPDTLRDGVVDLRQYYQNHSVYTEKGKIQVPYRYIVPLNITFNRSLQNLSSYYTDIGFIWIFMFIFTIFTLIYSIIKKDKKLFALAMSSTIGRAVWRIIGGAILWYGIGLIMWTILVVSAFLQDIMNDQKDNTHKNLVLVTLGVLVLRMLAQMFFNFIRISSQGASGPFLWFKQSVGQVQEISSDLRQENDTKIGYSQKDVFDLQFPHYNRFIEYTKDRDDNDGVLIAGTYLQYFLDNQHNIKSDGMLAWFWEQASDGNACKAYHRLKQANLKYLVIDPNIATVVMGEGNESLFHRFFAKVDPVSGKIIDRGSMMMLAQLIDEGYLDLFYSNNLGAKYAFSLSDEDLRSIFGSKDKEGLIYLRAQLAAARFMNNTDELINGIAQIFNYRVSNGQAIQDIADIYGKQIQEAKLINTVNVYLSDPNNVSEMVASLTQDERFVLVQYLNLYTSLQQNNTQQYQQILNNMMMASIGGSSQLIIFKLR